MNSVELVTVASLNRVFYAVAGALFFLSTALVIALAFSTPLHAIAVPSVLLIVFLWMHLFAFPQAHLLLVLAGFVAILQYGSGTGLIDAAYGFFYASYLVYWYFTRLFTQSRPLVIKIEDVACLLLLIWIPITLGLTVIHSGHVGIGLKEILSLSFLAFYFPIREACTDNPRIIKPLLGILLFFGLFIVMRNLIQFQEIIASATAAWQIGRGRTFANEGVLSLAAIIAMCGLIFARGRKEVFIFVGLLALLSFSLLLTQSRAYWIDFVFGAILIAIFSDRTQRKRLFFSTLWILVLLLLIAVVFFSEYWALFVAGISERIASLGTATTTDLSLINRFYESQAVRAMIWMNPIVGYGPGVPYSVFDLTYNATMVKYFAHNGFWMFWFKYGIIGLTAICILWFRGAVAGMKVFRLTTVPAIHRMAAFSLAVALLSSIPSATMAVRFYLADSVMLFTICVAMVIGLHRHYSIDRV